MQRGDYLGRATVSHYPEQLERFEEYRGLIRSGGGCLQCRVGGHLPTNDRQWHFMYKKKLPGIIL